MEDKLLSDIIDTIKRLIGYLCEEAAIRVKEKEETVSIEVDVEDGSWVIGRGGRVLDALQFIVYRMVKRKWHDKEIPSIMVDVNGYRRKREEELSRMARDIAHRVRRSGKSVLLEPMTPWERRVVHVALREEDNLVTESEDTEEGRRVRVKRAGEEEPEEEAEEEKE